MRVSESKRFGPEEKLSRKQRALLSHHIKDLPLKIEGSHLEGLISQLYTELGDAGIQFKPKMYLSDGWGCPDGVPVVGIPFYLADQQLWQLEEQLTGIESETQSDIMKCLRHEAGHAFNYAYLLYRKLKWRELFGSFSKRYIDDYRPIPFSAGFVRNTPGWYGQKHPDDDFAETFAVWLTPSSNWREVYSGTPALAKLLYVDRLAREYGSKPPRVVGEMLDRPIQKMNMTLETRYRMCKESADRRVILPHVLDEDLRILFPAEKGMAADGVLRKNKNLMGRLVNNWTGINRPALSALIEELISRCGNLDLKMEKRSEGEHLARIAVFVTTLAMNYVCRGKFIDED